MNTFHKSWTEHTAVPTIKQDQDWRELIKILLSGAFEMIQLGLRVLWKCEKVQ